MSCYGFIRDGLFLLESERAHHLALTSLNAAAHLPHFSEGLRKMGVLPTMMKKSVSLANLQLDHSVGLAAGMDKNAEYLQGLFALGFAFIEVGTVTPKPQLGNSSPRLFRLPEYRALINRLGFNNDGVNTVTARVRAFRDRADRHGMPIGKIGINIGKNANTPVDKALDDYLATMKVAHGAADYLTINVSSPNTKGLRDLQSAQHLRALLLPLREFCANLNQTRGTTVSLWLKVAPDLTEEDVALMAEIIKEAEFDGVITTNTTLSRDGVAHHRLSGEEGGLSGAPLTKLSHHMTGKWREVLPELPIIGVGGIMSAQDALERKHVGANAVQLYTGLIYEGAGLVAAINHAW